jgi:type II secretory pathway component PulF
LLLNAGLPITRCIEASAAITANPYIERDLLKAIPEIKAGSTLIDAFGHTRSLTPMAREMLLVGEQSGNLDLQMKKVSEFHLAEANEAVQIATKVAAQLIFFALAALIGYIVITFYANLYGGLMDGLGI